MIEGITQELEALLPEVLMEIREFEEGRYRNQASLNAFIGSKRNDFAPLHMHSTEAFLREWFLAVDRNAAISRATGNNQRHELMHRLIRGAYPAFQRYLRLFLERQVLRHPRSP